MEFLNEFGNFFDLVLGLEFSHKLVLEKVLESHR